MSLNTSVILIQDQCKLMPASPGVYKMIDEKEKILYIGKAKNLPKRVISYSKIDKLPNRLRRMVAQIHHIEYIVTNTEAEALLLEANLIKNLKPVYNILLRDDKTFPYIWIDTFHEYPRITKFHGNKKGKQGEFYGPFGSSSSVSETIAELQKIFLLRPCSDAYFSNRQRPCLQFQIKRCSAPCVDRISREKYIQSVAQAKEFLSGKSSAVQNKLQNEMLLASDNLDFEKAAILRDRIKTLTQIQAKNAFSNSSVDDADLIALYQDETSGSICIQIFFIRGGKNFGNRTYFQNGYDLDVDSSIETFIGQFYQRQHPPKKILLSHEIKSAQALAQALYELSSVKTIITTPKRGDLKDVIDFAIENAKTALIHHDKERFKYSSQLQEVQRIFHMPKAPQRIEVYDNSHIQGSSSVGCMIVAGEEGFLKDEYRVFNIKETLEGDDYAMMREVLTRRLKKLTPDNYPDLILIDGGKGQLSIVQSVFDELGVSDITMVCISKGVDRNAGREFFHATNHPSFQLPRNNPTLHYLQILRDEAHRFAIETHRKKRARNFLTSGLDAIPGIGALRKKLLLAHFGSVEAIKSAAISDLTKIRGISTSTAKIIYDFFRTDGQKN